MRKMRIALFGLAAIGAVVLGIGAAEMQQRFFAPQPKPSIAERAAAAQGATLPISEGNQTARMVRDMSNAIQRSTDSIVKDIREDCLYRHPDRDSWGVRNACVDRQRALYETIKKHWQQSSVSQARNIIIHCMDRSRTLHGFDWQDVSWCFERTAVAVRQGT